MRNITLEDTAKEILVKEIWRKSSSCRCRIKRAFKARY